MLSTSGVLMPTQYEGTYLNIRNQVSDFIFFPIISELLHNLSTHTRATVEVSLPLRGNYNSKRYPPNITIWTVCLITSYQMQPCTHAHTHTHFTEIGKVFVTVT